MKSNIYLLLILLVFSSCENTKVLVTDAKEPNYFELNDANYKYVQEEIQKADTSELLGDGEIMNRYLRWQETWQPRAAADGNLAPYFAAKRKQFEEEQNDASRSRSTKQWWEIGPRKSVQGSVGRGKAGVGIMEFVTFYDNSPNFILSGSTVGGLFGTIDNGLTWKNLNSDTKWVNSACNYAAFHPNDQQTIFAVSNQTGSHIDAIGHGPLSMNYTGHLLRSRDFGLTWEIIGDADPLGQNNLDYSQAIHRFAINTARADEMYIVASAKLYKSDDINNVSPSVPSILNITPPGYETFSDVDYHHSFANDVFVSAKNSSTGEWTLLHSSNSAAVTPTWTTTVLPLDTTAKNLVIETTKDDNSHIYLLLTLGSTRKLYKYNIISRSLSLQASIPHSGPLYGSGYAFDISDQDKDIMAINFDYYGRISLNGGTTWIDLFPSNDYHSDWEHARFHPITGDLFLATHGGIYKYAITPNRWEELNVGLGTVMTAGFGSSQEDPDHMIIGMGHNGSARTLSGTYFPTWTPDFKSIYDGDGFRPLVDNDFAVIIYQYGADITYDRGNSHSQLNIGIPGISMASWSIHPIFSSKDKNVVFMAGQKFPPIGRQHEVLRSNAKAASNSWELISDLEGFLGLAPADQLFVLKLISAPSDDNVLYANVMKRPDPSICSYCEESILMRTQNAKAADPTTIVWELMSIPSFPDQPSIRDVEVDFNNSDVVYIAFDNNFFPRSNYPGYGLVFKLDYGIIPSTTMLDPSLSLLDRTVSADGLVLENGTNEGMYLSTDFGVYYRNDSSTAWEKYGEDLPHVRSNQMTIDDATSKLRIGTVGRGIWQISLKCPDDIYLTETGTYNADAFKEAVANINSTAIVPSTQKVSYRAGKEIHMKPGFQVESGAEFRAKILPCEDY